MKIKTGNCRGFSLVELMIAVAILSIGVLAVAVMQLQAVNNNIFSMEKTRASNIATAVMDELMMLPGDHAYLSDISDLPDVNNAGNDSLDNPVRVRALQAGNNLIPAGGGAGSPEHNSDAEPLSSFPGPVIIDGREYFVYWNINDITPVIKEISVIVTRVTSGGRALHRHQVRSIKTDI